MKKNRFSSFLFWILLMGVIIISASFMLRDTSSERLKYSQVVDLFKGEQVKSFVLDESNQLKMELQDGSTVSYKLRSFEQFYLDLSDTVNEQKESGIITDYDMPAPVDIPWWVSLLPYLIMIGLFIALWIFMMNQANGRGGKIGSFGKSHAKTYDADKKRVTFADVAGADEEKEELVEIVQFLKDPAHFSRLGAKIPHGVLLVGPPGTGKTLLAKAVAGEAGVPFFSISGSDFVEMYVGVGASRVRDLFANAKKHPAAIIFIDEIDAVGRHRGAGLGGGHDEREQTLNQLLVEMDGFDGSDGVIVIAATNRPDILDPALLRPGRFDRQVTVNYPDIKGREAILRVHSKGKPFEGDVDLSVIARSTTGFTGADLANLLNEAALLAARRGKSLIGMNDIEDAMIKVVVGTPKKSSVISEKERKLTAYHEAGHAIVGHILQPDIPVHQISIIPGNKGTGGYTMSIPTEDRSYMTVSQMKASIAGLLGGRMAEKLILDDVSTGASNDIQRATNIARNMVTKYGMSAELGPIVFGSEHSDDEVFLGRDFSSGRNYSEQTAAKIDSEIYRIIEAEYNRAERILTEKMDKLHFIAEFLIKNEIMDEGQFKAAMETDSTMEQLEEMKSEQRRRSERENAEQAKRDEEERRRREQEQKVREREEDARIKAMREAGFYVFPARPFPDESSDDRDDPGNDTGTDASDSRDKTDLNDTTDTNDAAGSDASSDNTDNADSDSSKPDAHDSSNGSDSSDASDSENSSNDSDDSDNDRAYPRNIPPLTRNCFALIIRRLCMTLKRTRLFGCVRFVFYSGILRTAPLWVHIIRAVTAKQNKWQRQYPRREFSSDSRRGYCSNNIRFIITAVLQSSVPCQSANIADNKHKIIIAQLLQLLDRRLQ